MLGFAAELYQRGILTKADFGGVELNWGDADAFEQMIDMVAKREGIGNTLAEGCLKAVVTKNNPTHHAEMNLVQLAWRKLPAEVIQGAALFTSTEPCAMCTGAIIWSGIRRVVFSFSALELGKLANDRFCWPCNTLFAKAGQKTEVVGPVLAELGLEVHVGFWKPA